MLRVYEKPTCSTCVKLRALLDQGGVEYERVDYHASGLTAGELREIVEKAGVEPRELLRTREPLVDELGLDREGVDEEELLEQILAHPVLLQRPIVVGAERALLARPVERVLELLDGPPAQRGAGAADRAGEQLVIAPGTTLTVIARSAGALELEAAYAPGGTPPPGHLHPEQDERFEVLRGAMRTRVEGADGEIAVSDVLEIPRGTPHQMWNDGEQPALLRWMTMPAGRTHEWFRELAAIQRGEPLSDPSSLLERYSDVFRLAEV